MKVGCTKKSLADNPGSHNRVTVSDELAVGFVFKQHLRNARDDERVGEAEGDGERHDRHEG